MQGCAVNVDHIPNPLSSKELCDVAPRSFPVIEVRLDEGIKVGRILQVEERGVDLLDVAVEADAEGKPHTMLLKLIT